VKKILSIGEATIDSFMFLSDGNVHCNVNHSRCEFCLKYAEKVIADDLHFSVGGNAANTSVAFSRFGLSSQIYSITGDDWIGKRIHEVLEKEDVDCQFLDIEPGNTSYANILVFKGERNLIVYHVPRKYHLPKFEDVDWLYLTSMGKNYLPAYEQVLTYVKNTGVKVGFNPGSYQLRDGVHRLRPFLKMSEVLFLNLQEARSLTELRSSATVHHITEELYDLGPKIINITDGANGAYCFDGRALIHQKIFPGKVIETTGAGDAYAAGFTAALFYGEPLDEAMRWGMANSASVISQVGAQKGLLAKNRIVEILNDHPNLIPKVVH